MDYLIANVNLSILTLYLLILFQVNYVLKAETIYQIEIFLIVDR